MCPPNISHLGKSSPEGFIRVKSDEPHKVRRAEILKKYPQIKELYGPDIRLLPSILALVAAQMSLAIWASTFESWPLYLLLAWSVGGCFTHWLSLGCHELAHNLCFKKTAYNEILGIFANLGQGIPNCITFKRYHLEHHYHQGEDFVDVDIPTDLEGRLFNSTLLKILFIILQPFFYAFRPCFVNPKPLGTKELMNYVIVIGFNLLLGHVFGYKAYLFNILSTLLGMGLHPCAGHFISEHYVFEGDQETYSYYGPLNYVTFNVGYHNEHHDFPRISGFRLPQVRKIAPEFYNNLDECKSWPGIIYAFITTPNVSPYSRVKRAKKWARPAIPYKSD